jgi:hypothetical protein
MFVLGSRVFGISVIEDLFVLCASRMRYRSIVTRKVIRRADARQGSSFEVLRDSMCRVEVASSAWRSACPCRFRVRGADQAVEDLQVVAGVRECRRGRRVQQWHDSGRCRFRRSCMRVPALHDVPRGRAAARLRRGDRASTILTGVRPPAQFWRRWCWNVVMSDSRSGVSCLDEAGLTGCRGASIIAVLQFQVLSGGQGRPHGPDLPLDGRPQRDRVHRPGERRGCRSPGMRAWTGEAPVIKGQLAAPAWRLATAQRPWMKPHAADAIPSGQVVGIHGRGPCPTHAPTSDGRSAWGKGYYECSRVRARRRRTGRAGADATSDPGCRKIPACRGPRRGLRRVSRVSWTRCMSGELHAAKGVPGFLAAICVRSGTRVFGPCHSDRVAHKEGGMYRTGKAPVVLRRHRSIDLNVLVKGGSRL